MTRATYPRRGAMTITGTWPTALIQPAERRPCRENPRRQRSAELDRRGTYGASSLRDHISLQRDISLHRSILEGETLSEGDEPEDGRQRRDGLP
jgi:hypothetical protein